PSEPGDVHPGRDDVDLLDRAAREPERQRKERVAAGPGDGPAERCGHHPLLDVAVEVLAFEVAAEHVAGLELPDAKVARKRLAPHFHSRAPRRHTYTNATISSTTNTTVSL